MNANGADWKEIKLGKILRYLDERVTVDDEKEYLTITVKRRHGGLEIRERLFGHQIATKKQFRLVPGAFIISRVQCWHQAYAIVGDVTANTIASTNYDQFAISPEVDPRFFWWLSHSPAFTETVRSSAVGVVIEKMVFNRDEWLTRTVRLPPLAEQRRVVARIEELATQLHEARTLRHQAAQEADALLHRATANLLDDKGWAIKSLGEILAGSPQNGLSPKQQIETGGRGMLRINAVSSSPTRFVDMTALKQVEVADEVAHPFVVQNDDVFIVRYNGDINRVAKPAIYKGANEARVVYPDKLMRLRPERTKMTPDFLVYALSSRSVRDQIEEMGKTTAGNIGISGANAKSFKIPVPPLSEQRQIVADLDALQSQVDALKRLQAETAAELDALLPAILDKAFKGEL
jgi:type I restriction enzyme S subunit